MRLVLLLGAARAATGFTRADALAAVRAADKVVLARLQSAGLVPGSVHAAPEDSPLSGSCARVLADADVGAAAKVGHCSLLDVADKSRHLSALSAYCGPLVEPPHLLCRIGVSPDDAVEFSLDYVPRADAGYALQGDDGEYPEPASRGAFEMRSRRREFAERWFDDAHGDLDAVGEAWASGGEGPLCVDARLPLSRAALATAIDTRTAAVERWIGWVADAEPVKQVESQLLFAYDVRARARCNAACERAFAGAFGAAAGLGDLLEVALGPPDMADRTSSMSAAAADHNFREYGKGEMRRMVDDDKL